MRVNMKKPGRGMSRSRAEWAELAKRAEAQLAAFDAADARAAERHELVQALNRSKEEVFRCVMHVATSPAPATACGFVVPVEGSQLIPGSALFRYCSALALVAYQFLPGYQVGSRPHELEQMLRLLEAAATACAASEALRRFDRPDSSVAAASVGAGAVRIADALEVRARGDGQHAPCNELSQRLCGDLALLRQARAGQLRADAQAQRLADAEARAAAAEALATQRQNQIAQQLADMAQLRGDKHALAGEKEALATQVATLQAQLDSMARMERARQASLPGATGLDEEMSEGGSAAADNNHNQNGAAETGPQQE